MAVDPEEVKLIFGAAVEGLVPDQWDAFLDERCQGKPDLRGRVKQLLEAHVGQDSLLDAQPAASAATIDQPPTERPGATIGPYKLREQIGEGGMGVVYVAEQSHPVRRKVALKVIKPGMDTQQVVARFEAERQALAMMDHPNIAKVHDGGTTESGRPYFVMELVPGLAITEFCDRERLSVRQRLELFVLVCRAVQHAHQKGIIHRDLKPSNILITLHDGVPVPKVIDFGVAKAMGQSLTDKTVYTALSQLVGTPLYMSPEQAEMNQLGVDTRSDVYSLGVLLYELLTGTTPFDKETFSAAGLEEMRRMIREDDPPRPSTRVSTLQAQALSTTSQRRGTDPRRISAALHGELDWIVMKSLEKDRGRRYESAGAFATDVQRYLDDEPVLACPPSTMYKFHKFARKHKAALSTAVAIAASLILGTTASAWQAVRATTAEAQANANATQAQEKAREATTQRDEVRALNEQLRRTTYTAHMNLAQHAWEAGDLGRVRELLEQHRPKAGESDLRGFEWHYLNRLCHMELLTLKGHNGPVNSVVFSPDGKRLASAGRRDGTVRVWDAQAGQELLTLKGGGRIVVFSPDGKRLASASVDNTVKVWDAQTGQELLTFKGHTAGVGSVTFSPDGKRLASASAAWDATKQFFGAGEVKVWDAETGQELLTFKDHTASLSVAFSPDGKRLASAGQKPVDKRPAGAGDKSGPTATVGEVKVWDVQTGQELLTIETPAYYSRTVAFSPDGKRLVHACVDGSGSDRSGSKSSSTMKVWDVQTGQELLTIKAHDQVNRIAFSPDGKRLVSGAGGGGVTGALIDRAVRVWDAQTGQELFSLKGHTNEVTSVVFSPDGNRLASASRDGTIKVWDATTSPEARTFSRPSGGNWGVAFSPDGKRLGSTSWAKTVTVKVWDAQTSQELFTFKGHTGRVLSVAFSPDGKRLASGSASRDDTTNAYVPGGELKVWDAQTGQELLTCKGGAQNVVFSPDGKRLASASYDNTVKVWDAQAGQELLSLKEGGRRVVFSPDGKRLATAAGTRSGGIKVWDAQTGQELLSIKGGGRCVAFSPDGKRLASPGQPSSPAGPSGSGEVKIWDAQTGQELLTCKGHTTDVGTVAFSPDGKRLAGATWHEAKVWDAQTGLELLSLKAERSPINNVAFSPNGHWLASDPDGRLTIWDATPLAEKP